MMVAEALWICEQEENTMIPKQVIPGQQKVILVFLSPYLMGGHLRANHRTGPRPAAPIAKDYQGEQFSPSGQTYPKGI